MPKLRKNASTAEDIPFEEALGKLEAIVTEMEGDELDLETLLARYREGTTLARTCHEKLSTAELLIKELEQAEIEEDAAS